ncbi:hypothetical protein T265_14973, partial [Opisthorchis viverrini]
YVKYDEFECLVDLVAQNPSVIHQVDQNKQTLLHHAASTGNLKIVKFLVANNAQFNEVDNRGNLPLHLAIMSEHKSAAKFLLSIGSEARLPNKNGLQPIHLAAERNDKDTLKILLKISEIDVNAEGERGASPLHYCCQRDSVDCLQLLHNVFGQMRTVCTYLDGLQCLAEKLSAAAPLFGPNSNAWKTVDLHEPTPKSP